jgi:hypothetical protein
MRVGEVRIGEILHFLNTHTNPPKKKFNVCVARGWFFVINTLPNFPPTIPITRGDYGFLSHDSFICCSLVCEYPDDLIIPDSARRGTLRPGTAQLVLTAVSTSRTLTPEQKRTIQNALRPLTT